MSVRCDASGDDLYRNANLPSPSSFTACGWARIISNIGAGTPQPLFWMFDAGLTDGVALFWNTAATTTALELDVADGGVVTSSGTTASRPAVGEDFVWYVRCSGTGAGLVEAGYRLSSQTAFSTCTATLGTTIAAPANLNLNAVIAAGYYCDKRLWNVKVWDRALTQAEIEWESRFQRVVFPTSLNFHSWLRNTSDIVDRSGNGRTLSTAGTLGSEDEYGLWVPRPHQIPRRAAAAATIYTRRPFDSPVFQSRVMQ